MRERLSLDRDFRFALGHACDAAKDFDFARDRSLVKSGEARGAASPAFDDSSWRIVNLPHDWAIELPLEPSGDKELCEHGFRAIGPDHPENSVGWYRRRFHVPESDLGRRISIEFDGVFRDSIVWINGHRLGRHASGYTGFAYDVSDLLNYGGENVLVVRADATSYEGWWYEGAGIYRHVWLLKTAPVHVIRSGVFITSRLLRSAAEITVRTRICNDSDDPKSLILHSTCLDAGAKRQRRPGSASARTSLKIAPWGGADIEQKIGIARPGLWSPDQPNLYELQTTLKTKGKTVDQCRTTFGIRSLRWDARKGFFLNGKPLKIKGTCNHQQHAGVGIALPDRLHELRIEKLKELGANAYRCSHYAVAPELLDACDRLGMLVIAENRLAGSAPGVLDDFERMIRRDRNHPSIVLWSIGNEEHTIQWSKAGERIGRTMIRLAHQLDPTRQVTAAMHDRGLDEGFANVVDVHGWNYINVGDIEAFHCRRPDQPIIGTEEGSTLSTRGVYADDPAGGYVSAYATRTPKWGSTAEHWWSFFANRDWLSGGFVWTGFDYRGEPTPYKWPCTGSHFGLMDQCGFPKDLYYYYQAWWSTRPVLHLFPHWNFVGREGEEIDIRCFSNCDEVELMLNDRTLGRQSVVRHSRCAWTVRFEPGRLEARGFKNGKQILVTSHQTTGKPARIALLADRSEIRADGQDVASVTVSVLDSDGLPVPTAVNLIEFRIRGEGHLLGVGNGDPSSHESEKAPARRLFSGLALALVQSNDTPGKIVLSARSEGLRESRITIVTSPGRIGSAPGFHP
jgi:beta-galactosidase